MDRTRIRLLLVVSHHLYGEGVQSLLEREADLTVVGIATTGDVALALAIQQRPTVVLIDAALPTSTGVSTTAQIRRACPEAQVILLVPCADVQLAVQAADAGALSSILMTSPSPILLDAIRAAARGERRVDPVLGSVLLHVFAATAPAQESGSAGARAFLSPREREVLRLKQQGYTTRDIARLLCISEHTVKSHVTRVHTKTATARGGDEPT